MINYKRGGASPILLSLKGLLKKQMMKIWLKEWRNTTNTSSMFAAQYQLAIKKLSSNPSILTSLASFWSFKNITYFDDIELFLREVFDIYRRYLRVHKIEPGCVKVTLQFDANMEPFLQDCIDKKREAVKHYAKMHILSIAGICIPSRNELTMTPAYQCMYITRNHRPTKYTKTERSHSYSEVQLQVHPRTKSFKRTKSTRSLPA